MTKLLDTSREFVYHRNEKIKKKIKKKNLPNEEIKFIGLWRF
jgi:hypothetical protein